jgi:hypothetical protein
MAKLTRDGRKFRKWLTDHFETGGCAPLADELVHEFDHLATLRRMADEARAAGDAQTYLKLCNAIAKSTGSFARYWRLAGLSTIELPAEIRNATTRR